MVPRQILDTSRPVRPRRACSMGPTLTRLVGEPSGYGHAMTQPDPTEAAVPPNVQVYESDPSAVEGAALDRQSGRRLPFVLVGVLVVALVVALVRRRRTH
jgi:hypothetical protein